MGVWSTIILNHNVNQITMSTLMTTPFDILIKQEYDKFIKIKTN